ncbi:WD40 repeat protein [Thecaphora frezii]
MYWPTSSAKRLHLSPSGLDRSSAIADPGPSHHVAGDGDYLPHASGSRSPPPAVGASPHDEHLVQLARSRNGQMWAALHPRTISIWQTRPAQAVAALTRTAKSVQEYGKNVRIEWRPDGRALLVETDKSFLLLYNLVFLYPSSGIYSYIPASGSGTKSKSKIGEALAPGPSSLKNSFAPGAGESAAAGDLGLSGLVGEACELRFRLVVRIDAGLQWATSIETHMLVSTISPPAVQCIRWPDDGPDAPPRRDDVSSPRTATSLIGSLDWMTSTPPADSDVPYIGKILYSRPMDVFVWVASDGRVYAAHLDLADRHRPWQGYCFHGARPRRRRSSANTAGHLSRTNSIRSEVSEEGSQSLGRRLEDDPEAASEAPPPLPADQRCTAVSINAKFSLIAVGLQDGTIAVYNYRAHGRTPTFSHTLSVRQALKSTASYLQTGSVHSMSWTSDGYALAVGWDKGLGVWSTYGKLMGCSLREDWETASKHFSDSFMFGVRDLFWGPGNTELFVLAHSKPDKPLQSDNQLFILPFAKSAVAGQHSPDNTRYAFFQTDDSVHVYRGGDQPDLSVIDPESDVWHHIKIPQTYLAANWPIRYASISADGKLIAVAGRRGLAHFSSSSGRWKTHKSIAQEQSFVVRGGMQWFQHVLIAACDAGGEYQLRLYSRDMDLDSIHLLDLQVLPSSVILTSLFDNSLLVYTADNTFYHFLIDLADGRIRLRLCGSITFEGVVGEPARVRGMSWMIPPSQQRFGDPVDDLTVATIIFLIDGKLVLLRPRRTTDGEDEVAYDMQILADRIEYYWTHLQGIGTLENSLWGYDGTGIKLWLDALTIEHSDMDDDDSSDIEGAHEYKTIEESVRMPLDFYPLCVLLEKGIVIGIESEISLRRSLDFAIFRTNTNTHLFLHQILRNYLENDQLDEAVFFASYYQSLVYFAHALEILLHAVLEDEADAGLGAVEYLRTASGAMLQRERSASSLLADVEDETPESPDPASAQNGNGTNSHAPTRAGEGPGHPPRHGEEPSSTTQPKARKPRMKAILPLVVEFLDHFDEALGVVVGCARKTEVARWGYLFDVVGKPRELFEKCLSAGEYRTAGMYLLVLHNLEPLEESIAHTIRLLKISVRMEEWGLCRDLLRFLKSIDDTGEALETAVRGARMLEEDRIRDQERERGSPMAEGAKSRPGPLTILSSQAMGRSSSAPTVLDPTVEEEEQDDDLTPRLAASPFPKTKSTVPQRAASARYDVAAPVPEVTINGRIMPSRRRSSPNSSTSLGGMGTGMGMGLGMGNKGLGMSLSRVGLRSSERLWDTAHRSGSGSPVSAGGASWLGNGSGGSGSNPATPSPKERKSPMDPPDHSTPRPQKGGGEIADLAEDDDDGRL